MSRKQAPSRICILLASTLAVAAIGCASPGPPRPPSLNLPEVDHVALHATRTGDTVQLTFTQPTRTSDHLPYKDPITVELCRQLAAGPCTAVLRKTISVASNATTAITLEDPLPSQLISGPDALLTYRVRLFNTKSKTAGFSGPANAAAGPAPPPVTNLIATASAQGSILRWQQSTAPTTVEIERTRTSAPAPTAAKPPKSVGAKPNPLESSEAEPAQIYLRAGAADAGGTLDTTAHFGESYTYTATRIRRLTIGAYSLEIRSAPSTVAAIAMRDTFPPAVPQGLIAIPATGAIDLSWRPDTELDLAGYIVYRSTSGTTTAPTRLNPQPLPAPAFHDTAIQSGRMYRYTVTAIDSTGNESAPSAAVDETPDTP